jgi:hypothetical protein
VQSADGDDGGIPGAQGNPDNATLRNAREQALGTDLLVADSDEAARLLNALEGASDSRQLTSNLTTELIPHLSGQISGGIS